MADIGTRRNSDIYHEFTSEVVCSKRCSPTKNQNRVQHAAIDKLGMPGRWLRHKLLDGILVGTPVLLTIQSHRTPLRTFIMKMISFLGTEDFYTVLFLLIIWTLDSRLGRLFGILMGVGFYTAGVLKTLLCLPRPPSPPVIPEEKAYDWALPSHHSLLGTILPWYIWLYVNVHHDLTSYQLTCIFLVILSWSFSVLFSRLYLGVHSPADIVSGGFVGVIVLSFWLQIDDIVDKFISQQSIETPLQCILLFVGLLYIHPRTDPGNPSFTDNCCLFGVVSGLIIARSQRGRLLGYPATLETLPQSTSITMFAFIATLRLVTGGLMVFAARSVMKMIVTTLVALVYQTLGLKCYSSSEYRKAELGPTKHYTSNFCLPPIYVKCDEMMRDDDEDNESKSHEVESNAMYCEGKRDSNIFCSTQISCFDPAMNYNQKLIPYDLDVPTKCILYTVLTYSAVEIVPQLFTLIGL